VITQKTNGGRCVELFLPFEWEGKEIKSITISPLLLDHVMKWQRGEWQDSFDLLAEISKQGDTTKETQGNILRQLRYPDADRVLATFFDMLPPEIRVQIQQQNIPQPQLEYPQQPYPEPTPAEGEAPSFDLEENP
jgi:hypothetical protein